MSIPQDSGRPRPDAPEAGVPTSPLAAALAQQETDPLRWEEDPAPPRRRRSFGRWMRELGWRHAVGVLASAFALFPLLYVLSASLDPTGTMASSNRLFSSFSGQNYVDLFSNPNRPFGRWFLNTMVIGVITSVMTVFLGALAAYAFSRMRFTGRRVGLLTLLLVQMFPQLLAVVAIFLLLTYIGNLVPVLGIGSQLGLILVYLGGALGVNTYLMYGFFNTIPPSLDEAAKLDGVSKVICVSSPAFAHGLAEPVSDLIVKMAGDFSHIVMPSTASAKNIAPRVAALLDVMVISDVMAVVDGDTFARPIYAGNAIQTVKSSDKVKVLTVRTASFDAAGQGGSATVDHNEEAGESALSSWVEDKVAASDRPELTSAKRIVSGGRAVGSKDGFQIVEKLADKLGAAVGASRAAVDSGYAPNDWQVGQTGKVVAPDLYIEIGRAHV